jgi:Asp-tRNA(Asn)/Glu-tRNA(Gln) amidotransferase A subunit family amidase
MDAAKILQVIAGPDANDNYTLANPFGAKLPDYVAACKLSALQGKRIGIPRNVITTWEVDYQAPYIAAFNAAVSVIQAAGATVIDNTHFTAFEAKRPQSRGSPVIYTAFPIGGLPCSGHRCLGRCSRCGYQQHLSRVLAAVPAKPIFRRRGRCPGRSAEVQS